MTGSSAPTFPWSFSRLNLWRMCPRWFDAVHVSRTVVEPVTEAMGFGTRVHEHIANRLMIGADWPDECASFGAEVDRVVAAFDLGGERFVEYKVALDRARRPCDWSSEAVWVRAVLDFLCVHDDYAVVLDWKTGRRRAEPSDQLRLFALVVFALFPKVETVSTSYIWLRAFPVCATTTTYRRVHADAMWAEFARDAEQLSVAVHNRMFPPRPSGLCRRRCPVTSCQFHGSGK